jgi:HSP20 family protein
MTEQELKVQQRKEVQQEESTKDQKTFVPAVDIFETENEVTVIAEMPGVGPNGADVDLEEDVLTIRGDMEDSPLEGARTLVQEYESGSYLRRFTVAETIDQEKISASMSGGLLTIILPKMEPAQPKKIEIKVS